MRLITTSMIAAGLAISGCASSSFVSSWQAPDAEPLQVEGARVAAAVLLREESARRSAEDALARELTARGAVGVPFYTIAPDARPENEAEVRAAVEGSDIAGVVVMRPVARDTEIVAVRDPFIGPRYNGFWGGYYGFGWGSPWGFRVGANVPVEVRTDTVVSVETLVYSLRQNKLVWGGQSRTTNPSSVDRLIEDTAAKAAKELRRRNLIAG